MNNISSGKTPSVFYVILGISILSLVMMLVITHSQLANILNPNVSVRPIDLAQLAAGILLNIFFITLLFKRSKTALSVAIINLLFALSGAISLWIFQDSGSRNVNMLIGQAGATIYCLLVVLKLREFCRNGLLR